MCLPARDWRHTQLLQQAERARTTGLQPNLVETQDVAVAMGMCHLGHVVQHIDQTLELVSEFSEYHCECLTADAGTRVVGKRAVRVATHGNVIVDVDQPARKALRKESGNKQ